MSREGQVKDIDQTYTMLHQSAPTRDNAPGYSTENKNKYVVNKHSVKANGAKLPCISL